MFIIADYYIQNTYKINEKILSLYIILVTDKNSEAYTLTKVSLDIISCKFFCYKLFYSRVAQFSRCLDRTCPSSYIF